MIRARVVLVGSVALWSLGASAWGSDQPSGMGRSSAGPELSSRSPRPFRPVARHAGLVRLDTKRLQRAFFWPLHQAAVPDLAGEHQGLARTLACARLECAGAPRSWRARKARSAVEQLLAAPGGLDAFERLARGLELADTQLVAALDVVGAHERGRRGRTSATDWGGSHLSLEPSGAIKGVAARPGEFPPGLGCQRGDAFRFRHHLAAPRSRSERWGSDRALRHPPPHLDHH
jgi:hypothetical protein